MRKWSKPQLSPSAPSQEQLKSLLFYHEETGIFFWTKNASEVLKGKPAGGLWGRYIHIRLHGKMYPAHRLAWLYKTGQWPTNQIDHINGDTRDNSFKNLREATASQNGANKKLSTNNTSGVKGVRKAPNGKWVASVSKGNTTSAKVCGSVEEAKDEYLKLATERFGDFARLADSPPEKFVRIPPFKKIVGKRSRPRKRPTW